MLTIGISDSQIRVMRADLNLLTSLQALLEERSVTKAAARLGLSQPTLSTALGRLRRQFGDDLLMRTGNVYVLTPMAERLLESTNQALFWADRVFDSKEQFVPAESDRVFRVVVSDAQLPIFGKELVDIVGREAPGVRLRFEHSTARFLGNTQEWLRSVDALVLPQGLLDQVPNAELYRDAWVCVVDAARSGLHLTHKDMAERAWVMPYEPGMRVLSPDRPLGDVDFVPRSTVITEDFLAVPHLVAGSERIGLMPARIARLVASECGVVVARSEIDLGELIESLWWHPVHDRDPGHRWLREVAARAAANLTTPSAG
jgi:DNA-binding transcriptional LysR family regulator